MNNSDIPEQAPVPVPELDIQEPEIKQKIPLMLGLGTCAVVLVLIGAYVFARSRTEPAKRSDVIVESSPSPSVAIISATPNPTPTPTSIPFSDPDIPPDWSLRHSEACGVSYFLPPSKEPYVTNFFKNYPYDVTKLDEHSLGRKYWESVEFDNESIPFKTALQVFLANPDPNPNIGVGIMCADNSSNLTTESLFQNEKSRFAKDHDGQGEIVKKSERNLWGYKTYLISYVGDANIDPTQELYLVATPGHIYLIYKISIENDQEEAINVDANTLIFNKLKLE